MSHFLLRSILSAGCLALLAALGCEAPEPNNKLGTPGALPRNGEAAAGALPKINAATYLAHANLLERQGEFAAAAGQYRKVLEITPDSLIARNRLGITLNKLGENAEATKLFRETIDRHGGSAALYNNLGFSLYLEEKYDEADAALREATTLEPEFARAHMNRGLVLAKLQRWDEAHRTFAAATSPSDAHYNVALLQAEGRHYAAAARSLELALQINPDFDAARQELREVSRRIATDENPNLSTALASTGAAPTTTNLTAAQRITATTEPPNLTFTPELGSAAPSAPSSSTTPADTSTMATTLAAMPVATDTTLRDLSGNHPGSSTPPPPPAVRRNDAQIVLACDVSPAPLVSPAAVSTLMDKSPAQPPVPTAENAPPAPTSTTPPQPVLIETKPAETKPTNAISTDVKPVETKPNPPAHVQVVEAREIVVNDRALQKP